MIMSFAVPAIIISIWAVAISSLVGFTTNLPSIIATLTSATAAMKGMSDTMIAADAAKQANASGIVLPSLDNNLSVTTQLA